MNFAILSDSQIEGEIGRRLRRRRVELGFNQTELGEKAGVDRRTISSVENGGGCSMGTFIAILRALGSLAEMQGILPESEVSPIALTGTAVKERKYPYKPRSKTKEKQKAPWQWGDEES